jgi:hypothetical protein
VTGSGRFTCESNGEIPFDNSAYGSFVSSSTPICARLAQYAFTRSLRVKAIGVRLLCGQPMAFRYFGTLWPLAAKALPKSVLAPPPAGLT